MESRLTFLKCFFCCKNFNKLQLIDLNNSVLINEEELSYINLIFDICFLKVCLHFMLLCRKTSLKAFRFRSMTKR